MTRALVLMLNPQWRLLHGLVLPSRATVMKWLLYLFVASVVTTDLIERSEILALRSELQEAISIAKRAKQCLEGRRTLGTQTMEDGEDWDILCYIKYEKSKGE